MILNKWFLCRSRGGKKRAKKVEKLILNTLKKIVNDGIPQQLIKSCLHQYEINIRRTYGLELLFYLMPCVLHGGNVIEQLNFDAKLIEIKKNTRKPRYLETLIENFFLKIITVLRSN